MFRNKIFQYTIGIILGGILGFLYWKFIGCKLETRIITSKPLNSTIYGSVLGVLIASGINKTSNKK